MLLFTRTEKRPETPDQVTTPLTPTGRVRSLTPDFTDICARLESNNTFTPISLTPTNKLTPTSKNSSKFFAN